MSGWDVARALRADPAFAALPVIALTAHAASRAAARRWSRLHDVPHQPVDMKALERSCALSSRRGAPMIGERRWRIEEAARPGAGGRRCVALRGRLHPGLGPGRRQRGALAIVPVIAAGWFLAAPPASSSRWSPWP